METKRMNPRSVVDARRTGFGIIQPGAHPEFDKPEIKGPSLGVRIANTFRNMVGGDHPDTSAIEAEIAAKHAEVQRIRGAKILKKRTGY